jgi:hypothetical protein
MGMMLSCTSALPWVLRDGGERNDSMAAEGWHWILETEMLYRGSYAARFDPVCSASRKALGQPASGVKVVVRGRNEVTMPFTVCGGTVVGGIWLAEIRDRSSRS